MPDNDRRLDTKGQDKVCLLVREGAVEWGGCSGPPHGVVCILAGASLAGPSETEQWGGSVKSHTVLLLAGASRAGQLSVWDSESESLLAFSLQRTDPPVDPSAHTCFYTGPRAVRRHAADGSERRRRPGGRVRVLRPSDWLLLLTGQARAKDRYVPILPLTVSTARLSVGLLR